MFFFIHSVHPSGEKFVVYSVTEFDVTGTGGQLYFQLIYIYTACLNPGHERGFNASWTEESVYEFVKWWKGYRRVTISRFFFPARKSFALYYNGERDPSKFSRNSKLFYCNFRIIINYFKNEFSPTYLTPISFYLSNSDMWRVTYTPLLMRFRRHYICMHYIMYDYYSEYICNNLVNLFLLSPRIAVSTNYSTKLNIL